MKFVAHPSWVGKWRIVDPLSDDRSARKKLDTAMRVQPTIPANPNRRMRSGQEDSQIQSPTTIGRNNAQTMISATKGSACTQFQSKSSHSRFTTSAIANPAHNIAKITMAYVLSTRGTVTPQNDEFLHSHPPRPTALSSVFLSGYRTKLSRLTNFKVFRLLTFLTKQ